MILPTLRQLQYLVALREHKSFSKAAEACFVTQSTLSAGIKELEKLVGQDLVDRSQRQIALTPAGLTFTDGAADVLSQVNTMVERTRKFNAPMSGPLRLGVIPTIAPYLLPKILPQVKKQYPGLDLQLHEDLTARLLDMIKQGRLDLVLMAFPYDTPGLEQNILFEEPFYLACHKTQPPAKKRIQPRDLDSSKLLLLEDGHCLRDHALAACNLQAPDQRRTFRGTSMPTLIHMVSHGYGMTLLPAMMAGKNHVPGGVRIVPFSSPAPTREVGLAWRKNSPREKDFKTLGKLIRAASTHTSIKKS